MRFPSRARRRRSDRSRGQSLVELALVLPVILLLLLVAIDFGRVYLGWINLNQMARIAANFASTNPDADFASPSGTYQTLVLRDARAINCDLPPAGGTNTAPTPTFTSGTDLGDPVTVAISCQFGIITPIISGIVGGRVDVSASSTFSIRTGAVDGIPTGGGGTSNIPIAEFSGSPTTITVGQAVTFTDLSSNAPITWSWNFGDGNGSNQQNPTHTYSTAGTYPVSLTVSNPAGSDTETKSAYILVNAAPTGLAADFTASPVSGPPGTTVTFTDTTTGGTPTTWAWDFGNGQTATTQGPHTITYNQSGSYDVTLTVGDGTSSHTRTYTSLINIAVALCDVPNVSDNENKDAAIGILTDAGFTNIVANGPSGNWKVKTQSPAGGFEDYPCDDVVTISSK